MKLLATLLLSIVIFDACQACCGKGWQLTEHFLPVLGISVYTPGTCPHCRGFKVMPAPPNQPPLSDQWEFEACGEVVK